MEHLDALELRLSHERARLRAAKSPAEARTRGVWVDQIEKEIAAERKHLGLADLAEISDDDLLKELTNGP